MATWTDLIQQNPHHSENYAQRWRSFAAEGRDIDGEARLIDALAPRHARILDAGCGTGRVGGYLAQRGHDVTGCDLDPVLIGYAQQDYPNANWHVGDLCTDPIPGGEYDIIVSAGNVMGFLPESGRLAALRAIAEALRPTGRAVIGFGAGRGWAFPDFLSDAARAGLELQSAFSSWELHPFSPDSDFLVALFIPATSLK
ncbi:class I SAM-dependent methyltransferase [Corynebacterium felinum]|uniref:SAM-dependent methyltransferase n=1 Tax=Corynebacterium felinum TaxID=131318 RepID=A0ABU2B4I9_9CORY|nr:class I SAM-dependent methyltransferase [Corynebacterium felinum]MDF5821689.1 class I SAM-dependent methyltransferase [Corynebacterium felinum]MDR7353527.1 SAM-dependent methyltransferase [Corynebacterium felinum]WJY95708.1 dTDP-3-amino-3,4,6-trideoxy-alpha-D-glucopyranose [Corynebacterium felinum]